MVNATMTMRMSGPALLRIMQPNRARVGRKATQQIGGSWLVPRITMHGGANPLTQSNGGELMGGAKVTNEATQHLADIRKQSCGPAHSYNASSF